MSEKKKRWSLSNLLFDEVESKGSAETEETVNEEINVSNTAGEVSTPTTSVASNFSNPSGNGVFDQKFADILNNIIEENNIPGIDYFEFLEALKNMSGVAGVNESTAIITVYATLKAADPSLTREKILNSIEHYDSLMVQEEQEFSEAMSQKTSVEVEQRRTQANQLTDENKDLIQQIQNINEKIAANQTEAARLNQEAAVEEANISQINKNFTVTLASVRAKLSGDKERISTLIQDTKTA